MALKRAVLVRPKNAGELWPQTAGLAGSGWDLASLAMRAAATGDWGATEIFPAVAGWLRRAATGKPAELLCIDRSMRAGAELVDAGDTGAMAKLMLVGDHWRSRLAALWSAIAGEVGSLLSCRKRDSDCNCSTRGPHFYTSAASCR
jgi:hypothetical protein